MGWREGCCKPGNSSGVWRWGEQQWGRNVGKQAIRQPGICPKTLCLLRGVRSRNMWKTCPCITAGPWKGLVCATPCGLIFLAGWGTCGSWCPCKMSFQQTLIATLWLQLSFRPQWPINTCPGIFHQGISNDFTDWLKWKSKEALYLQSLWAYFSPKAESSGTVYPDLPRACSFCFALNFFPARHCPQAKVFFGTANGKGPPGLGIPVFWNCNLLCQFHNAFVRKEGCTAGWECVDMPFPFATSCGPTPSSKIRGIVLSCPRSLPIPPSIKRQQ